MAIAYRILRDAELAQDAVQTALIAAWRELRTLRDPDRFEPWLHQILTNECYAEARRRTRWSANIRLLPVDGPRAADGILTVNDRDQLERAFRRLTLEQRAVLVFHRYVGLPLPEVAERLGIPLGTAKSRGGSTGWHAHPYPVFITVVSGTLTFYEFDDPTCTPIVVTAGQGYVDAGHGHIGRNETAQPAVDISVIMAPVGAAFRAEVPAPNPNCGF
jgi:RNA polymerase sigma-70 factor, ECF subfamily